MRWAPLLAELGGPLERVVVTHLHPDHVGGAADAAAVAGATVFQGHLDYEQCRRVWGGEGLASGDLSGYWRENGMPAELAESIGAESRSLRGHVHFARDPEPLEPGGTIGGWTVLHLPGHADGHLALLRDGVLVAGDAILGRITPQVGLYPHGSPDPLADYLESLRRIASLAPRVAFAGHGEPIDDPAARAREISRHHAERLEQVLAALNGAPRSGYDVSLAVFPNELSVSERRFALAESLAHLEHLDFAGRAERLEDGGVRAYARG